MSEDLRTADPQGYLARMLRGEVARPPVLTLLGSTIVALDLTAGSLQAHYEAREDFRNPAGTLGAMLDDLCASLVDATLSAGQGVATLSLNLVFLRPARVGRLEGQAKMLRRGRDVCHVQALLSQNGQPVAQATAVCKVMG